MGKIKIFVLLIFPAIKRKLFAVLMGNYDYDFFIRQISVKQTSTSSGGLNVSDIILQSRDSFLDYL